MQLTQTVTNMSQSAQLELSNWCRGEGISVKHALMLYGVSEEEDISAIEQVVETIKILGKVRVRGKMFDTKTQTVTVLCESREEIDPTRVPLELNSPTESVSWTIAIAQPQTDDTDNFSEKLAQFLQDEGRTMDDIPTVKPSGSEWTNNPESIIRAVGEVLRQSPKSSESNHYRRLRTFSGISPTPLHSRAWTAGWIRQGSWLKSTSARKKRKNEGLSKVLKGQPWRSSKPFGGQILMLVVWSTYRLSIIPLEVLSQEKTFTYPLSLFTRSQMNDYLSSCAD